jgi:NAD(P) transhydrogenase subunit alpha
MVIGFLKTQGDDRCPVSTKNIEKWKKAGVSVLVEKSLGNSIGESFEGLEADRADIIEKADVIYANAFEDFSDFKDVKSEKVLISFFEPYNGKFDPSKASEKLKFFSMDMIPRSTLAQSMDALSSMASISGYQAVLLSAAKLPKYFPMMMTAAGTVKPSAVLIIGAGVAGLQAVATARKLGSKVEVFDVRKAVKQEVESLGAKFVEVIGSVDDKDAGGYAVEQSEDYIRKQKEEIAKSAAKADVIICTAQLRGKPAPTLITKEMVESMKFGSVIIDMASSTGGNCEVSEDEKEINYHGIKIIGDSSLYLQCMQDASALLANNIFNFTNTMIKEGALNLDMENEILSSSLIHPKNN